MTLIHTSTLMDVLYIDVSMHLSEDGQLLWMGKESHIIALAMGVKQSWMPMGAFENRVHGVLKVGNREFTLSFQPAVILTQVPMVFKITLANHCRLRFNGLHRIPSLVTSVL